MRLVDRIRQRLAEQRQWSRARTLQDLGELTAQWLEGRIRYQPGYCGPVDVDDDLAPGMVTVLARLNRAGFVTTGSQAGWDGRGRRDDGFTQMAAVEGICTPDAATMLRRAVDGTDYRVGTGRVAVSHRDGAPYTGFGGNLSRREVARLNRHAARAVSQAEQVVVYDPQIGRNTLWGALDEATTQPDQENTTMTSPHDNDARTPALRNSVRPGPQNTPGSQYDNDPRVRVDGSGGYTVTTGDGPTLRVQYTQTLGWGVYTDDRLPAGAVDGYASPDHAFAALIGAPQRRPEANDAPDQANNHNDDTTNAVGDEDVEEDFPGYRDAQHLLNLAHRCERGAAQLTYEAENAAVVLAARAGGDQMDPQVWAARQAAAATAAHQYAQALRAEAAAHFGDPGSRPTAERIAQAQKVAAAAANGGILIDGTRLTQSEIEHGWHDEAGKQALRDGQAADDAAIAGSGMFGHVAETIDGVDQVPFWQLGGNVDTNQRQPHPGSDELHPVVQAIAEQQQREAVDPDAQEARIARGQQIWAALREADRRASTREAQAGRTADDADGW